MGVIPSGQENHSGAEWFSTLNSFDGRCNLCLEEKIRILIHKWPDKLSNKRSELIARCRHKTKFKL